MAAAGALTGSRTFVRYLVAGTEVLERDVKSAVQFAYNLTGFHSQEIFDLVSAAGRQMLADIVDEVKTKAMGNEARFGGGYTDVVERMLPDMERKLNSLL